jgi:hypothetical protein
MVQPIYWSGLHEGFPYILNIDGASEETQGHMELGELLGLLMGGLFLLSASLFRCLHQYGSRDTSSVAGIEIVCCKEV